MEAITDDLYLLHGWPRNTINIYFMGGVLVDAGTRYAKGRILRQLRGRRVTAHALTHGHADHQGASKEVCKALNIPLWCSETEVDAVERGDALSLMPNGLETRMQQRWWAGAGHPVARKLREGDEVGGFTVIESPGHSPGHLAYWREADRTLVMGDVLFNMNMGTGRAGLREPPLAYTLDPRRNRQSLRKLAALKPEVICFGHGPPLRDGAVLQAFVARLPD